VDTDAKKMERFPDGLDGKLYERLNLLEPENFHELVNKAISQEDAMKQAHRDKKRPSGFAPGSGANKKFRFVKKNVPNPSQQSSTGRWTMKPSVTPAFLAPNKSLINHACYQKPFPLSSFTPFRNSGRFFSPRRVCRESRRHRPHPGHHPRVPPQRRGRPPRWESRTAAVLPASPPRHHRCPGIDAGV
jgi:hypothetical protein